MLEQEIARLTTLQSSVHQDWRRARWAAAGLPLALPAGFALGLVWFWLVLFAIGAFLVTARYLVQVRWNEYDTEIQTVKRELGKLRRSAT